MDLKVISRFFYILAALFLVYSCGEDSVTEVPIPSSDAQIYTFKLEAKYTNSKDSLAFATLAKTKFVIDQSTQRIYNPDSLPFDIPLKNYLVTLGYSPSGSPSGLNILYRKATEDSIVTWNGKDSVNFSKNNIKIEVKAPSGTTSRTYSVELRVHKIDADTIVWKSMASAWASNSASLKTVALGSVFYCFSSNTTNALSVRSFDPTAGNWNSAPQAVATPLLIQSITTFNNALYAVNASGNVFTSTNGVSWTDLGNQGVKNILGVLPSDTPANDVLLAIMKDSSGKNYFTKMTNAHVFTKVTAIKGSSSDTIVSEFPANDYSSMPNLVRTDSRLNMLLVTGGKDFNGKLLNNTWMVMNGTNELELSPSQINYTFAAASNISTFGYDSRMYAIAQNKLFISSSLGSSWISAPTKQSLPLDINSISQQSVIVDAQNYIWLFGKNITGSIVVWKGRLNRLNV